MKVWYLPAAEAELDFAIARYERIRSGLGIQFRAEVYSIASDEVLIVALAHQHRRTSYWRHRIEEPIPIYAVPLAA